jgi:hypothetical protein
MGTSWIGVLRGFNHLPGFEVNPNTGPVVAVMACKLQIQLAIVDRNGFDYYQTAKKCPQIYAVVNCFTTECFTTEGYVGMLGKNPHNATLIIFNGRPQSGPTRLGVGQWYCHILGGRACRGNGDVRYPSWIWKRLATMSLRKKTKQTLRFYCMVLKANDNPGKSRS